jgi:hypothetical protein
MEDEEDNEKEFGIRTFIPPSLTDSDEYWHDVATRCFAISTQLGAPTFFLIFTINRHWHDYEALRRGDGSCADSAIMAIVLRARLGALMRFLTVRKTFGNIRGFVWRIEY